MAVVIGINSGSSFDGVDAVAIEIDIAEDGHPTKPRFIAGASYDWPAEVAVRVLAAFENEVSLFEMTRLNYEAGAVYADAAPALMRDLNLTGEDVAVIGFDGQTIYQEPPVHARLDEGRAIGRVASSPSPSPSARASTRSSSPWRRAPRSTRTRTASP